MHLFSPAAAFRGPVASRPPLVHIQMGDQPGRPTKATALEAASRWIGEMDQETAQDYATAGEGVAEAFDSADPNLDGEPMGAASEATIAAPCASTGVGSAARSFQDTGAVQHRRHCSDSSTEWDRLRQFAGTPPPRMAQAERRGAAAKTRPQPAAMPFLPNMSLQCLIPRLSQAVVHVGHLT